MDQIDGRVREDMSDTEVMDISPYIEEQIAPAMGAENIQQIDVIPLIQIGFSPYGFCTRFLILHLLKETHTY